MLAKAHQNNLLSTPPKFSQTKVTLDHTFYIRAFARKKDKQKYKLHLRINLDKKSYLKVLFEKKMKTIAKIFK